MQLAKAYEPKSVELDALKTWNEKNLFRAEPTDPGRPFSIVIPPPNVTAALHLGHALNNTLQDILVRWHRMLGDNAIWFPGTDHAGIATQTVVEKRVLKEEGKRRTDFPRDEFVKKIQAFKDEYEQIILGQLKRMGCSCDWDRTAFTMDEARAKAVREAFFQLFKAGLIYRGKRLVNWDPVTQTALADDEVEMEEVDGFFYYLRYPIVDDRGTGVPHVHSPPQRQEPQTHAGDRRATEYITVATTRPETMLGDTAVAINPKDPRAAALKGKFVRLPIVDRIIPIIEDDYVVLPDAESDDPKAKFATGFLKVTPAHDPNDYEIGQRHNLEKINVLAPDATISDKHGWTDVGGAEFLLGLDRYEAREAVVEWFRQNKLLEEVKPYRHSVGHSYRSHVAIEPYLSDQWYCKVTDDRLAGAALRVMNPEQRGISDEATKARSDEGSGNAESSPSSLRRSVASSLDSLTFFPPRYAKTYQLWHENIRDWCISRQLWWGHRIPVWSRTAEMKDTAEAAQTEKLREWRDKGLVSDRANREFDSSSNSWKETTDGQWHVCVRSDQAELLNLLAELGFRQDPDVLDTWFSSALWPMSTMGWPQQSTIDNPQSTLNTWNPSSILCTAREIITLWVSRMVMFNEFFLNRLPFKDVFVHAMIQDGEGRKMSKSLGNGVDPLDIIDTHGADAMRFTLTQMTTNTQDVRMPVEHDAKTGKNTSPKFDVGRNFCNKLWNACRFVLNAMSDEATKARSDEGNGKDDPSAPSSLRRSVAASLISSVAPDETQWSLWDRWILHRLGATIKEVDSALAEYRFDAYAKSCYDFFWRDLCDWYIEAIKPAMKDPARAGQTSAVLAACIDGALRLMHPMIPFITEMLFAKLNDIRPDRSLPNVIELPASEHLIKARWPKIVNDWTSPAAEFIVPKLQEIITAIRTIRNDHKVEPKRSVTVSIKTTGDAARAILSNKEVIELLGTCTLKDASNDLREPGTNGVAKATTAGCELFVEGVVDEGAEKARVSKRREELTKEIAALEGRLSNEGYIARAPAHLVQQTKDQLQAKKDELTKLG
jgi:valyl-tRNA synthetase